MQQPTPARAETRAEEEEVAAPASQAEPTVPLAAASIPGEVALAGTPSDRPAAAPRTVRTVRRGSVLTEPGYRAVQLVWLMLTVAEALVALRVIFKAVNANPSAGFVSFVTTVAGALVAPFHPIVADARLGGGGVLETGSLIAMAVFLAAALVLVRLIRILTAPRLPAEPASV